ncbi:MAG: DEAD/DEAH box helicase [Pseudomonadota bacterium]
MHILHGSWLPAAESQFENQGRFLFWVENEGSTKSKKSTHIHPYQLTGKVLSSFFTDVFRLPKQLASLFPRTTTAMELTLPSSKGQPLPSPELAHSQGSDAPDAFQWQAWRVSALAVEQPLPLLKEIHFQAPHFANEVKLGSDLLFWCHFGRAFREVVNKHHYIPTIIPYQKPSRGRGKKQSELSFTTGWLPLSARYQELLTQYGEAMPGLCRAVSNERAKTKTKHAAALRDPFALLNHFCAQTLDRLVEDTHFYQKNLKAVAGTLVANAIAGDRDYRSTATSITLGTWQQWQRWRRRLEGLHQEEGFVLCFRLQEAPAEEPDNWYLEWLAASRKDPSLQLSLADYWLLNGTKKATFTRRFGKDFGQQLLLQIGQAARMYPKLWQGLDTDQPVGLALDRDEALTFLREHAWVLEDSGYRVIVPAWWTPQGRRRALLRLRAGSSTTQDKNAAGGHFSLPSLARYRYELAIGGKTISEQEWRTLVESKSELVLFRGQWMELNQDEMSRMLAFWERQGNRDQEMPLSEFLQKAAGSEEENIELIYDGALEEMMARLRDAGRLTPSDTPNDFHGQLRAYQQRGLAWLNYLERLGMGPCLADDMGLGKTIQVIALLLNERATTPRIGPTLLIAPTSVLGNWHRELERFAPSLKAIIHHGPLRPKKPEEFNKAIIGQDVIISSFALIRLDSKLFLNQTWHRVVVDEAHNLKNPRAAQTRAITKLDTLHRMALTGTPIENRLLDLWSIFHFLNPGYLGTSAQFKKRFESPIQKDQDMGRATTLKRLVEPFILRRLKTDKGIIKDLPDKVEQKVYCNLTPEQASLYQAVVDEVQDTLAGVAGIQRKGLILSTLMRLKQICNHPAQFLQDGSEFSEPRSHKLERIAQMVEEVIAEGESLLLFTQFTEVGKALERLFRQSYHYSTRFLHGGTSRNRRERMITEFQDPDSEPSVFILSLKAGGVGITLTRANHVFHFDRWWNPAVENQATDRAYRIGQEKKVFVHKMVTLGTLEERIDRVLEEKQRLAESIVGSDEAWLSELDDEAFRELIELNRSEAVLD